LNVRNVPDAVLDRLGEQAAAEGVSLSEWVLLALTDRADRPTVAEQAARREARAETAQSAEEFATYYRERHHRPS
jgi:hypothetical protein